MEFLYTAREEGENRVRTSAARIMNTLPHNATNTQNHEPVKL